MLICYLSNYFPSAAALERAGKLFFEVMDALPMALSVLKDVVQNHASAFLHEVWSDLVPVPLLPHIEGCPNQWSLVPNELGVLS